MQPIWLSALAALSVPVVIHLWNQRPGKTLKVGSIALARENVLSYKKRIQLSHILLLLLRCLLLACIALALAEPFWRSRMEETSKGWVLMDRQSLPATYKRFKPVVDSLLQAGFEFHFFETGFAKADIEKLLPAQKDSNPQLHFYRRTIAQLNERAADRLPMYIFTDNYLRNFSGQQTASSLNLHWFTYTPDTSTTKVIAGSATLLVTICARAYPNDGRYLTAALDAIGQFSKKNIIVRQVAAAEDIPANQDWLFWLNDEYPLNTKNAKHVLLYAKGEKRKRRSFILPAAGASFAAIDLYAAVAERESSTSYDYLCWQDGFGHPLLAVQQQKNASYYYLFTHFDPSWNELPWSDNFPAVLYRLLYPQPANELFQATSRNLIIDSTQVRPVLSATKNTARQQQLFAETKLSGLFWTACFMLFFAERVFSFYHYKRTSRG